MLELWWQWLIRKDRFGLHQEEFHPKLQENDKLFNLIAVGNFFF